jgi:hypothetical protein
MKNLVAAVIVLVSCSVGAYAQEFQSSLRDYDLIDYRSIGGGAALNRFEPRTDNSLPDSLAIKFTTPMFFLEYRQMNIHIAVSYNHYSLRGDSKSAYAIYADGSTDLAVAAKRSGGFYIPIIVSTNYVRADGTGTSSGIFDVGSIGIGTGLKYRLLSETFGMLLSGGAVVHYSTVGFSIEYGSSVSTRGEIQFLLPDLLWSGITLGYRFENQQWKMSASKYNYTHQYHGAFVGLFF